MSYHLEFTDPVTNESSTDFQFPSSVASVLNQALAAISAHPVATWNEHLQGKHLAPALASAAAYLFANPNAFLLALPLIKASDYQDGAMLAAHLWHTCCQHPEHKISVSF